MVYFYKIRIGGIYMKSKSSRILSALLALTLVFSFCLSAFAANEPNEKKSGFARYITTDPSATSDGVVFDAYEGTVTMKSSQSLRLAYTGRVTENTKVTWSSSNEDAASIAEDGTVTTGSSCKAELFRVYKLPIPVGYIIMDFGYSEYIYIYLPIPIPVLPRYEGSTTVKMTVNEAVTDPETGNTYYYPVLTDSVTLTVQHTFIEWLRSWF